MFGIGWTEALVIGVLALIFVPTEDLPRVARELGRRYAQLRRTANDLQRSFMLEADRMDAQERFKELQERRRKMEEERQRRLAEAQARGAVDQAARSPGGPSEGAAPEAPSEGGGGPVPPVAPTVLSPEEDPETPAVRRPPPGHDDDPGEPR